MRWVVATKVYVRATALRYRMVGQETLNGYFPKEKKITPNPSFLVK